MSCFVARVAPPPQTIDVAPMRSAIVQERGRAISEGGFHGEWMIVNDLLEVRTVGGDLVGTRRLTLSGSCGGGVARWRSSQDGGDEQMFGAE
jgi:hypothetical protein